MTVTTDSFATAHQLNRNFGSHFAFSIVAANAGANGERAGECTQASNHVDDAAARKVDDASTEKEVAVGAERGCPACG